jgi:uncharacterized membrane protein YhfC
MMTVALIAIVYWKKRHRVAVRLFLWGSLAWGAAIALKSIATIPLPTVTDSVRASLPKYFSEPILWLYIGLLTGIFECGVTLGFAHIKRIRTLDWKSAAGFGIGFGGIEAFLLGAYSFLMILLILLVPDKLPPELLELANSANASFLDIPVPIIERLLVVLVHTWSCVLIIYAVQTGKWKWFWISFKILMQTSLFS